MNSKLSSGNWFVCPQPNPQARLRLYCFPYAGGGVPVFRNWLRHLPSSIELHIVQLPGRGSRLFEQPYTQIAGLVKEITDKFIAQMDGSFAFFGHSLGAIISFELARLLKQNYQLTPIHLFVSGHAAPQLMDPFEPIYQLPDDEFILRVRELNGAPVEVFENAELMELFLPVLRADFTLNETYQFQPGPLLSSPITSFGGSEDLRVPGELLQAWGELTTQPFNMRIFPGDHFFLHTAQTQVIETISNTLFT